MAHNKECQLCKTIFNVPKSRIETAKYCSRKCSDAAPKKHNEVRCRECGSLFRLKKSQELRNKVWGSFCSNECITSFRKRATVGNGNPNFKGRNFDHDGYRIYTPIAPTSFGMGKIKLHHAVAFTELGIKKLPKGLHVHHRDCDILNNKAENLAILTMSDHKWLHKQYGVATLKAFMDGEIDADQMAKWSDDPNRAYALLISDIKKQGVLYRYLSKKFENIDLGAVVSVKPVIANITEA